MSFLKQPLYNMTIVDWIGSLGVFLILLAYFLNIVGIVSSKHVWFIFLNLIGAILACLASILLNYWPFIILEGVWALVSLYALLKYLKTIWSHGYKVLAVFFFNANFTFSYP